MKTCYQLLTVFDVTCYTACIQKALSRTATWVFCSIYHFSSAYLKRWFVMQTCIMLTLFRIAGLNIKRQGYLVKEIAKPGKTCHSLRKHVEWSPFSFCTDFRTRFAQRQALMQERLFNLLPAFHSLFSIKSVWNWPMREEHTRTHKECPSKWSDDQSRSDNKKSNLTSHPS